MRKIIVSILFLSVLFHSTVFAEDGWTAYFEGNGNVYSIKASPDGTIWCSGQNGVFRFDGETWHDYSDMVNLYSVISITDDGIIWVGDSNGLKKYDGIEWKSYSSDDGFTCKGNIGVDSNGVVWSCTNDGLLRFDGTDKRLFTTDDGLLYNFIVRLFVARNGEVWCSYNDPIWCEGVSDCRYVGISHYDGEKWETFNVDDGLLSNNIFSIESDENGRIFISYGILSELSGISMFNGETWETITSESGKVITIDKNGVLWSVWGGNSENERLKSFNSGIWTKNYGMPYRLFVYTIDIDINGVVWLATSDGILSYDPMKTAIKKNDLLPEEFAITGNYPNPFNPSTTLSYSLANPGHVTLYVYNTAGQKVATLVDSYMSAGFHSAVFDGDGLVSGIYYYRIETGEVVKTGRMTLVK